MDDGRWSWTRGAPKLHRSSPGVERTFCADCGSPLSFRSASMTGLMHFFLAALEDPERFPPQLHLAIEEKRCWLALADDLPNREGPSVAPPD